MKLADALATALRDWDVRYVFGVSGANIEHFHDAIHRLGDGRLQAIMAKTEVSAAFMADCRARVHRTLGVCCATSGGGMMNLAVGIAEAYAEAVPMLAIVGQVPTALEGRGGFQDSSGVGHALDALGMFRAMTKYVARVGSGEGFWETLLAAVKAALSGRQGPSVLLIPRDVYELEVGPVPSWWPRSLADLERTPRVRDADLAALESALRDARAPVLLLGPLAARSTSFEAIRAFARDAEVPVVTTMASAGAFPHDSPLFLGMVGAAGHPSAHAYLNDRADLIVAVGTDLEIMTRHALRVALTRARLAVVNVEPGEVLRTADAAIVVEGDPGDVFGALSAAWQVRPYRHGAPSGYALTRYVPRVVDDGGEDAGRGASPLLQSEAIALLEQHLPEVGHVLFDAGNCAAAALHGMTLPRRATSTIALGMGGMGYAIAGAIGAQLGARAGTRTVVVCGDGAFLMLGLEIHTAVELGLPVLFVVFNNAKHGMCVTRQRLFFEGRTACSEYARIDVAGASRGLGGEDSLWTARAGTRAELAAALASYAGTSARPGVLELVLTREEMPPFSPFLEASAPTYVVRSASGESARARPAA